MTLVRVTKLLLNETSDAITYTSTCLMCSALGVMGENELMYRIATRKVQGDRRSEIEWQKPASGFH
jgi:hypothetical protein